MERLIEFGQDIDGTEVDEEFSPEGISVSTLKIKIQPITYQLHIENGSYDVFTRKATNKYPTIANDNTQKGMVSQKKELISKFLDCAVGLRNNLDEAQKLSMQKKWENLKDSIAKTSAGNQGIESETEKGKITKQEQSDNLEKRLGILNLQTRGLRFNK